MLFKWDIIKKKVIYHFQLGIEIRNDENKEEVDEQDIQGRDLDSNAKYS